MTPKGRAALRKPSEEVILGVWRRWLTHGAIDEFSRVEAIKGQRGTNVLSAGTLGLFDLDYRDPVGARTDYHSNWGSDHLDTLSRYDGLRRIRLTPLGAYALGLVDTFSPAGDTAEISQLTVLPNLDIAVLRGITHTERLTLAAFATQTADHTWNVSPSTLTAALGAGRDLTEFTDFLHRRAEHELPSTLTTLIDDVRRRGAQLIDRGHLRVIECADPATAMLIASDRRTRQLCGLLGDRFLGVQPEHESKFRTALLKLGFGLPAE